MKTNTLYLLAGLVITSATASGKTITNNAAASHVLGQPDFTTTSSAPVSATKMN
jgi:hypothetical protein